MASMMSRVSLPGRSAYSASKAALLDLTRALALELAEEGITVNAISPGPFATEMNTALLAVFPGLRAGNYDIWANASTTRGAVTIVGGEFETVDWR
jgi:NAD(P)-dependent dehydrogenase (short-subunit alcohol dehydrogenase family)